MFICSLYFTMIISFFHNFIIFQTLLISKNYLSISKTYLLYSWVLDCIMELIEKLTPLDVYLSMLKLIPEIIFPSWSKLFIYSGYVIKKNKNSLVSVCILYGIFKKYANQQIEKSSFLAIHIRCISSPEK